MARLAAQLEGRVRRPAETTAVEASAGSRKAELGRQLEQLRRRRAAAASDGTPRRPPTPAEAPDPPPRPGTPIDPGELAPGQREFLDRLTGPQRAAFDALPDARQAEILAAHRIGYDRCVGAEWVRKLTPRGKPRPIPETTEGLIREMPGAPPEWVPLLAEALRGEFEEDSRYFHAYSHLGHALHLGRIDPEAVIRAYREGKNPKARSPGAVFCHALKREIGNDPHDLRVLAEGREVPHG